MSIENLDISERQALSHKALTARWGPRHTIIPKHVCRLCGHNRKQTTFLSKSLGEEIRKLHCLPAWGPNHDPTIYYVIRDGSVRELSDKERQQLEGRRNLDYPKCELQDCPNFGKLMRQPRSQVCARIDGTSSYQVEVVTFKCLDMDNGSKHLHSVNVLQPDECRLEKLGKRGSRYRGIDAEGKMFETVPLTALHPVTRKPVDPEARRKRSLAHQASWNDLDSFPKLQNSLDVLRLPEVQEKRLVKLIAAHKGKRYPHRGPLNISSEERQRRSDHAKRRNSEQLRERSILESLGRPRKDAERAEANRLKAQGKSLEQIRRKMKKRSIGAVRNLLS